MPSELVLELIASLIRTWHMPESYLYLNRIHLKARKRGNAELIFTVA